MKNKDNKKAQNSSQGFYSWLSSRNRQGLIFLYDLLIYIAANALLLIFYEGTVKLDTTDIIYHFLISGAFIIFFRLFFKVYNQIWRYGGIQSYMRLLLSDGAAFITYYSIQAIVRNTLKTNFGIQTATFPRILSIASIAVLGSLSIRMVYRYAYKCYRRDTKLGKIMRLALRVFAGKKVIIDETAEHQKKRIAIVGAGAVGVALAEELFSNSSAAYIPICFIDTNQKKIGRQTIGLKVLSEEKADAETLRELKIQEVVFALPEDCDEKKKALYAHYTAMGFKVRAYDYPIIQQPGDKRRLRSFNIEELLFRKQVDVIGPHVSEFYKDKVVLITGGGGSIGSELCRQIAKMKPKKLVILDVYENGAYDVQQELRIMYGDALDLCVEILSVCNRQALEKVFDFYRPQIVLHAAAHKHVPLMEHNCCEAIENNVFGTLNTVELSEKYKVERFMMVSTDKAVNPTNVMGATKRMCELIVQCHSATSTTTTYSATRFGNVLGSAGSVIPLFKKQIQNGGPVTITDKRIIRYFMTIPEASQLVLQSAAMAKNGELFVLDMGKPVKILDLAENIIRMSGFKPYRDIQIVETGLRPGEKLYEELLIKTETLSKTENSLIFVEHDEAISQSELNKRLAILSHIVELGDDNAAKEALHKVVPTFKNPEEVNATAMESDEQQMVEKS